MKLSVLEKARNEDKRFRRRHGIEIGTFSYIVK
jgi:hypothetical protein